MSMSLHVKGIVMPDDQHKKIMAVVKACHEAKVDLPAMVEKYFKGTDYEGSEPGYILEECGEGMSIRVPQESWSVSECQGIDVEISKLPPNITKLRFEVRY